MRQTITERFGKRFYELFEEPIHDYECWHGFNVEKFKKDFVPASFLQSEHFGLLDYIAASVGYEAAKLIEAILNYGAVTFSLNGELEGLQDGQIRNFFIVLPNKEIEKREGEVYFPFAIHQEEIFKWTVTHLPTGYSIIKNLNREVASDLLIALCVNFTDELYTSEYRSEVVGKLYEFIMKRL
jgi:hypothetical protein